MSDNVHIVYNPNKGDVVSRLMVQLAETTGWSISKQPKKSADINYFGLYISVAQNPSVVKSYKGRTAAYFSHYETEVPKKVDWWHTANQIVDIRLTAAPQYLPSLLEAGEAYLIIPPIDPQFTPHTKSIVGVSGFVHPGGRKGEHLVSQLKADKRLGFEIRASGKGWDAHDIQLREWHQMPDFYRSLDVFLVTSVTEGIPMPPLEALACGVPVVAPEGVGLLDYLPTDHVFRYQAGDYHSMVSALESALFPSRKIRKLYNTDLWASSHQSAFAGEGVSMPERTRNAIEVKRDVYEPLPTIANAGAVVIAYGDPARACAEVLLNSWMDYFPNEYPIALVSDKPIGLEDIFIYHEDSDIGARSIKTRLPEILPAEWDYILYLDADTEIVSHAVGQLFHWLYNGWDFLICTNPVYYKTLEQGRRPDNGDETDYTIQMLGSGDVVQPNGGVFGWTRNDTTALFFTMWHYEWQKYGKRDQQALLRAMHKVPLRWLLLNNLWNTVTRYDDPPIEDSAGILHHVMNARRWTGIVNGRLDSDAAWQKVEEWERNND